MKTPTVTVYKDVLYKILKDHNIRADEMSIRLGYNRNYLSATFSSGGGIHAEIPTAAVVAMSALLAVKQDDITAEPSRPKPQIPASAMSAPAGDRLTKQDLDDAVERLRQTINFAANMLHNDLRALLAEWKPKEPVPPKYAIKEREEP